MQSERSKNQIDLYEKKTELVKTKKMIEETRKQADDLTKLNKTLSSELEEIKNKLLVHYYKILAEGKDTRYILYL